MIDARKVRFEHDDFQVIVRSAHGRAGAGHLLRSSRATSACLFQDGEYVETLPPGKYAFWKNVAKVKLVPKSTCARRRSTSPARRS